MHARLILDYNQPLGFKQGLFCEREREGTLSSCFYTFPLKKSFDFISFHFPRLVSENEAAHWESAANDQHRPGNENIIALLFSCCRQSEDYQPTVEDWKRVFEWVLLKASARSSGGECEWDSEAWAWICCCHPGDGTSGGASDHQEVDHRWVGGSWVMDHRWVTRSSGVGFRWVDVCVRWAPGG